MGVEVWTREVPSDLSAQWQQAQGKIMDRAALGALSMVEEEQEPEEDEQEEEEEKHGEEAGGKQAPVQQRGPPGSPKAEDGGRRVGAAASPQRQGAQVVEAAEAAELVGPAPLNADFLLKLGGRQGGTEGAAGPKPELRLQAWDFPGQREYSQLNLLYFSSRAMYLVFVDLSGDPEEEWQELKFWLWAIAQYASEPAPEWTEPAPEWTEDEDAEVAESTARPKPPIFLVGTRWAERRTGMEEWLQQRMESLLEQVLGLKSQLQKSQDDECGCCWLFGVENKPQAPSGCRGIPELRAAVARAGLEMVLPQTERSDPSEPSHKREKAEEKEKNEESEECEEKEPSACHAGICSERYPIPWLRGHDLLAQLGQGLRGTADLNEINRKAQLQGSKESEDPAACPRCGGQLGYRRRGSLKRPLRMKASSGEEMLAPKNAALKTGVCKGCGSQVVELSYDFLPYETVEELLLGMRPQALEPGAESPSLTNQCKSISTSESL